MVTILVLQSPPDSTHQPWQPSPLTGTVTTIEITQNGNMILAGLRRGQLHFVIFHTE